MDLHQTEIYTLRVGDHFLFSPGAPACEVDTTNYIDYYGDNLLLYKSAGHLFGHLEDHTLVWVY